MSIGAEIGNEMTDVVKKTTETRSFHAGWEIREAEDGSVGLRGYAAMFDSPAHGEVIRSGAFTKTLADGADVRLLVEHAGVPLARTKSGTMRLSTDERGLVVEVDSLDMSNPTVQELVSAMKRGDIDQMSFAFAPVREQFDRSTKTRELLEVKLFDVSVVTYPWYESTSVGLRQDLEKALVEVRSAATPEAQATAVNSLLDKIENRAEMDAETLACVSGCLVMVAEADVRLDAVLMALSSLLGVENPDEDEESEEGESESEGESEVSETEDDSARFARREIARALYLR